MKTERFEMRLDTQMIVDVDAWRGRQADVPSRAEAIRRLIGTALTTVDGGQVRIDHGTKLVVMMLRDLYRHLRLDGEINPDFVADAIDGGHHWALGWQYPGVIGSEPVDSALVSEVSTILQMWRSIEWAYDKLPSEDQAQLANDSAFPAEEGLFPGFDGNEETTHYAVADFLISQLRRFTHFESRDLNSHWPFLTEYRGMLGLYSRMQTDALTGRDLTRDQLAVLLGARRRSSP